MENFTFDLHFPYSPDSWRGRIRASSGVAASLSADLVEKFDQEHQKILERDFPQSTLQIPHRVFAIMGHENIMTTYQKHQGENIFP